MTILDKFQSTGESLTAELYACVTNQSRQYIFFEDYQVPDTPQGRFEILAIHLALMMRRLKFLWPEEKERFSNLQQKLCDWIVADLDESIRSMPVGELKIHGHLKQFIQGFYGRLISYDEALELKDHDMLKEVIRRNVYGLLDSIEEDIVEGLVDYTYQTWEWLEETSLPQIVLDLKEDSFKE